MALTIAWPGASVVGEGNPARACLSAIAAVTVLLIVLLLKPSASSALMNMPTVAGAAGRKERLFIWQNRTNCFQ